MILAWHHVCHRSPIVSVEHSGLSAETEACWTAITRGLLAQREVARLELLEDEIAVLAVGDGDAFGRSSMAVDAAVRRMHTHLAHASVGDMRRMPQAASVTR